MKGKPTRAVKPAIALTAQLRQFATNIWSTEQLFNNRISIGEDRGDFRIAGTIARYPVGSRVTVYDNPRHPNEGVLERDLSRGMRVCLGGRHSECRDHCAYLGRRPQPDRRTGRTTNQQVRADAAGCGIRHSGGAVRARRAQACRARLARQARAGLSGWRRRRCKCQSRQPSEAFVWVLWLIVAIFAAPARHVATR